MSQHGRSITGAHSVTRTWRLCLKELRESLRDRRTLVTLVLMPLIVYPLLSIVFQRFLYTTAATADADIVLGVADRSTEELLNGLAKQSPDMFQKLPLNEHERKLIGDGQTSYVIVGDLRAAVRDGQIDVGLLVSGDSGDPQSANRCEIVFNPQNMRGRAMAHAIETGLRELHEDSLLARLKQLGVVDVRDLRIAQHRIYPESDTSQSLATLVPLVLVLMTVTGAVYPAIDLTAGERERGTMEALIAAPIPRLGLLFAKYIAVIAVALLTATANLVAMLVTLYTSGLGAAIFGAESLGFGAIATIFALMILFASFFAAVLLAVTSCARSFKEAQAYIVPLILIALAPSLLCLLPGVQLTNWLAVTPLVNVVLLARDAFANEFGWQFVPLVAISTGIYAAAAIGIAARIFGSDAILFGSETSLRDLFVGQRESAAVPSLAGANLYLALLFPLYIWAASGLRFFSDVSMSRRLILSSLVSALLFAVCPLAVAWLSRLKLSQTFRWVRPTWISLVSAVLLGLSTWPFLHELVLRTNHGLVGMPPGSLEVVQKFVEELRRLPAWEVMLAMALLPAICEELFFRGFLLSSFLARMSARQSILLSAVLFGVFHVVAVESLAIERMLPSSLMGILLGCLCWRTGSVLPGMLLHATHNGLLTLLALYQPQLEAQGWGVSESSHIPLPWLAAAAAGCALGGCLVWYSGRPEARGDGQQPTGRLT